MRILALVPGGIAEQLLFWPTLMAIQRSLPTAVVSVVVEPRAKGIYDLYRDIEQVIAFDFKDRNSPSDWANLLGLIRDHTYDVVISTRSSWAIGLLFWLTGTPVRITYQSGGGGLFFTQQVPDKGAQYAADRYHDLLQGLNITTPTPALKLTVAKSDLDWASAQTQTLGLQQRGYVLLYGGAQWASAAETYPIAAWQAIAEDFQRQQPDLPLLWLQDEGDRTMATALTQAVPAVQIIQPSRLGQVAAIVAGASLLISTDSVPLQFGVGLGVYTLGLFGATDPQRQLPPSERAIGIASPTGQLADLPPATILEVVWSR